MTGQSLRRAVPAGVRIAFGTDAGVSMHGRNADEFLLMVRHGMTPMTAIEAATVNAADLLGLSTEVGTIEPGKAADIVAMRGDPLSEIGLLRNMGFCDGARPRPSQRPLGAPSRKGSPTVVASAPPEPVPRPWWRG